MRKNNFLIIITIAFVCYNCTSTDNTLRNYIDKTCLFKNKDTCVINLKDALKIDFDTMFIFGEYTQKNEISSILQISYKNTKPIEDSHYRIILLKSKLIIYEDDFEPRFTKICRGINLKKTADEKMTCYCRMYISPNFRVEKVVDDKGQLTKYFYILKNIQLDGTILPKDTIGVGGY